LTKTLSGKAYSQVGCNDHRIDNGNANFIVALVESDGDFTAAGYDSFRPILG
jgi:hypothetical protein